MNIELSQDQELALEKMLKWWNERDPSNPKQQIFYLAGWAGTGKTTIADIFAKDVVIGNKDRKDISIAYGSFTGKAALRMRQAGMKGASTLHSLIYEARIDKNGKLVFSLNGNSSLRSAHLLILDECSMVDEELGKDVLSFGVPILILGDKGQLPPIKGQGFFTNRRPDATLTQVHRQALDNPIIKLATDIREGKSIKKIRCENLITFATKEDVDEYILQVDQILVGRNNVRKQINQRVRDAYELSDSDYPESNERIICLRNNRKEGIFNGMIGTTTKDSIFSHGAVKLEFLDEEGNDYSIFAHPEGFQDDDKFKNMDWRERKKLNEFTYGYAITVHKAQGSQWDSVMLLDDNFLIWDKANRKRWLYTAVTRAAEKLIYARSIKGRK